MKQSGMVMAALMALALNVPGPTRLPDGTILVRRQKAARRDDDPEQTVARIDAAERKRARKAAARLKAAGKGVDAAR